MSEEMVLNTINSKEERTKIRSDFVKFSNEGIAIFQVKIDKLQKISCYDNIELVKSLYYNQGILIGMLDSLDIFGDLITSDTLYHLKREAEKVMRGI